MNCNKEQIYLAWNKDRFYISFTHDLTFDLYHLKKIKGYDYSVPLTGKLPIGMIEYLERKLKLNFRQEQSIKNKRSLYPFKSFNIDSLINKLQKKCNKIISEMGFVVNNTNLKRIAVKNVEIAFPLEVESYKVLNILEGRALFFKEIEKALAENNKIVNCSLKYILQFLYIKGTVDKKPAITISSISEHRCNRCGQSGHLVRNQCTECGNSCFYCEECISMGEACISETIYLTGFKSERKPKQVKLNLDIKLSKAQEAAYCSLSKFILEDKKNFALVWAVCSARNQIRTIET